MIKRTNPKRSMRLARMSCPSRSEIGGAWNPPSQSFRLRVSVAHFEPIVAGNRELAGCHPKHPCTRRPDFTPGPQFRQGQRCPFGLNFHTAITEVAHPTADAEIKGATIAAGAEPHPLNAAFDYPAPAFGEGLDSRGLLAADEALADRFSPASSAARHREQIVVELAQCR